MVKQYPYICVYASNETDFSHNGLRILCPTSCTITETLNGEYSLELTHPYDEWDNWKFLMEHNIIKAQGQLFRIYRKNTTMSADGTMQISVSALHIFYDLNYYFIEYARPVGKNGDDALDWIVTHTYTKRGASTAPEPKSEFTFSSDIKGATLAEDVQYRHTAYYERMSVTKAIMGADNAFLNVWGGELIRDNFNVIINKQRGTDNAFSIVYGENMTEIEEEVDYSDYCSSIYWVGTYKYTITSGGEPQELESTLKGVATLQRVDLPQLPVAPMQYVALSASENDLSSGESIKAHFDALAKDYMLANCSPVINYRVKFANLADFELYKDFIGLSACKLGDTGIVYNSKLGIYTTQQVIKVTMDGITGEITDIELGSLRKSYVSNNRTNGGTNSKRAEILKNEIAFNNTWEELGNKGLTMDDLNVSWDELAGNVIESKV